MANSLDSSPGCVEWLVDRHVRTGRGAHIALVEHAPRGRRTLTYAQVYEASVRLAGELDLELGGSRFQQRIAIVGGSTLETVCWWLAAMRAGHLPFLVHPDLGADAYDALFQDFDPARVYTDRTAKLPGGIPLPPLEQVFDMGGAPPAAPREPRLDAASYPDLRPAMCLASSGSTGRPKICVHSHYAVVAFEQHVSRPMWQLRPDDIVLGSSGPYFSFGLQGIHPALSLGATAVLMPEWTHHGEFLQTIEHERVSVFLGVPTLHHLLMTRTDGASRLDSLRICLSAGEHLPGVIRSRWQAYSGAPMLDSIGTTETFLPYLSERLGEAPGLHEVPAFHYTVSEVDAPSAQAATYTIGLSGRAMMLGYFRLDHAAGYAPSPEVMQTHDLFARDGDCWRFLSRRSERIKVAGHWVSPQELESFLLNDPHVLKAAAIPVQTPEGLTRLRAFVVLTGSYRSGEGVIHDLMQRMRQELKPRALRPDRIEIVPDLSSTASGKLLRQEVRAELDRVRLVAQGGVELL